MALQAPGQAISLLQIQTEFGGSNPISLSEYWGLATGLPTSGQTISAYNFYSKSFLVTEVITSSRTWTPKLNNAAYIHIFVFGAGGSGGSAECDNSSGLGNPAGTAAAAGGGGGGFCYSKISAASASSSTITIGTGGAGVRSAFDHYLVGNAGGPSKFVGSGLNMIANGGGGGGAREISTVGSDTSTAAAAVGGSASGGNQLNYTGGASGGAIASATESTCASGGGCAVIDGNSGASASVISSQTSDGARISNNSSWPTYLSTYQQGRSQSPILGSTIYSFDATSGVRNGNSSNAGYGAGSGGSVDRSTSADHLSGNGGNGIVIIVYEV
jgi:hypothetical protein